jgi:prevent-host-death family protein
MDETLVPISEAKGRLSELIRTSDTGDVVLLRHGRPAAVMLSVERYQALLDRCEDLADAVSILDRNEPTMDYAKFRAQLGFDD